MRCVHEFSFFLSFFFFWLVIEDWHSTCLTALKNKWKSLYQALSIITQLLLYFMISCFNDKVSYFCRLNSLYASCTFEEVENCVMVRKGFRRLPVDLFLRGNQQGCRCVFVIVGCYSHLSFHPVSLTHFANIVCIQSFFSRKKRCKTRVFYILISNSLSLFTLCCISNSWR